MCILYVLVWIEKILLTYTIPRKLLELYLVKGVRFRQFYNQKIRASTYLRLRFWVSWADTGLIYDSQATNRSVLGEQILA
jgi:hypothetical protein